MMRIQRLASRVAVLLMAGVVGSAESLSGESTASETGQFTQTFPQECVAADHPLASEAGAAMMRRGGNVVDAAVATAFALSVLRPESCGLGGGGFMVIWDADRQKAVAIDYRERAPGPATRDMYLAEDGKSANGIASRTGGLAVAVPGEVAGLCFALKKYGTLSLPTVLEPTLRLARDGFIVDPTFHDAQVAVLNDFARHPDYAARFAPLLKLYFNDGKAYSVGDTFHSPLAKVLERIAEDGPAGFHEGPVAAAVVEAIGNENGIVTLDDLRSIAPVARKPVRGEFEDYDIISMPPPSSGGIAIIEMFNILTAYERLHPETSLANVGHNSPQAVHLITEAMKYAFADRAAYLGDADFAEVPVARLLSDKHAQQLAKKINPERTLSLTEYGRFAPVEDGGTSHLSVIDRAGNAVTCTETINTLYGSYVVDPTYGIVLNNEMDDFAAVPDRPNAFGLIQSEANAVAPGKKPLSSMSPTILVKDGKATIAAGASGGPRIISGTFQVLLNIVSFQQSVSDAVPSPRFHHQWLPNTLFMEADLFRSAKVPLEERGHSVTLRDGLGVVQAVVRSDEGVTGASDPRKGGRPAGH